MLILCLLLFLSVNFTFGDVSDEYIDPVIDMLLNGVDSKKHFSDEEEKPVLISGVWKCGNCTDIDNSKLVYSEDNFLDDETADDDVDIQIELNLEGMRCVTVAADKPGVVRIQSGACEGGSVSLHVAPSRHFVIKAYN